MNLAGRFLGPEKAKMMSQAFDFASQITQITNNPKEALERAGVSAQDIKTAQTLLNNPAGNFIIKCLGGDKNEIIQGLKKAEEIFNDTGTPVLPYSSMAEQAPVNELQELQATLARLKNC